MVYPKITGDMPLSEKAHAFNINRAAIEASSLRPIAKLQLMGSLHNADTIVNIVKAEWEFLAFEECCTRTSMTIESFNNKKGQAILDCLDPATGLLKDLKDGAVGSCRPDGIIHMKVKVMCDFSMLDKKTNPKSLSLRFYD